jgi:hypothetical protein
LTNYIGPKVNDHVSLQVLRGLELVIIGKQIQNLTN